MSNAQVDYLLGVVEVVDGCPGLFLIHDQILARLPIQVRPVPVVLVELDVVSFAHDHALKLRILDSGTVAVPNGVLFVDFDSNMVQ
jgi:hypothetical protein